MLVELSCTGWLSGEFGRTEIEVPGGSIISWFFDELEGNLTEVPAGNTIWTFVPGANGTKDPGWTKIRAFISTNKFDHIYDHITY